MHTFCSVMLIATAASLVLSAQHPRERTLQRSAHVARQAPEGPVDPGTSKLCTYYVTVRLRSEDCVYLSGYWGIRYEDFVSWNPSVKSDCSGIKPGNSYCVEVNNGNPIPSTTSSSSRTSATPTAKPSPTLDGLTPSCNKFYFAVRGDTCDKITQQYGISNSQFFTWNPTVRSDCSGLWADYWYCVSVPGAMTTTAGPASTSASGPRPPSQTQAGIVANCINWYPAVSGDTCSKIIALYVGLDQAKFTAWNPAVGDQCVIWAEYSYCVGTSDQPATTRPPTSTTKPTTAPTPTPTGCTNANPAPTQPGAICKCKQWHQVVSGDSCWVIYQKYGITEAQFSGWNPGVNCNVWLGYYVCVGG